jgi:pilus assembly protein Flp/PilA
MLGRKSHRLPAMYALLSRLLRNDTGATAIEYALIAGGIALAIVGAISALGGNVSAKFTDIQGRMP